MSVLGGAATALLCKPRSQGVDPQSLLPAVCSPVSPGKAHARQQSPFPQAASLQLTDSLKLLKRIVAG